MEANVIRVDCSDLEKVLGEIIDELRDGVDGPDVGGGCGETLGNVLLLPFGRDGSRIRPGETVYGEDGAAWKVIGIGSGPYMVVGRSGGKTRELKACWLSHDEPDSWGRLWRDVHRGAATTDEMRLRAKELTYSDERF